MNMVKEGERMFFFRFFGYTVRTNTANKLLMCIPMIVISAYLLSSMILYAFVHLTGYLTFSWINSFWFSILLLTAKYIMLPKQP